ncbi:SDR family NAD(P)-dependent oxidoreductase [Sphingomonas mali]|uniref:SDR family NAD(P)-dependent oxidoreductase n=1 Tax=Sphingomonas mali TaxID=40682 RepID=UPI000835DB27|nr:SDR family NAD(P)-dependent oxidoreductase [Sphingomonas mali]
MNISLEGKVAIVTGAGGGLGRSHALALAARGARVLVNDFGGRRDGREPSNAVAQRVADEIAALGGDAIASGADVSSVDQVAEMVDLAIARWGRVDILVNNAGILRDRTFAKAELDDFRTVLEVHLMGSVHCTKAVWEPMRQQGYGRIVFTSSSSGLYGNFGQSSYAAAKMALVGLMNTLRLEGEKHGIRVNCLSPSASTRMTDDIMESEQLALLGPERVSPAVVALCAEGAPNGMILCAGGGSFERAYVTLTRGIRLGDGECAEQILAQLDRISDRTGEMIPDHGPDQASWEMGRTPATLVA